MSVRSGRGRLLPWVAAAALALVAASLTPSPGGAQTAVSSGPVAIEVNSRPISYFSHREPSRVRFGSLEFVSGLVLTSSFRGFGGLSALRLDPRGESFTAISDKGDWFTGRFVYRGKQLAGLANVVAAPILGPDGVPIARRGWYDTESLAFDGAAAYIGIERVNHILKFETFGRDGVRARGEPISAPPLLRRLPHNKGVEALLAVPHTMPLGGTLLAISERGLDSAGNILAFLIGGPSPGQFSVRRTEDYDVSDVALLPSGTLLLLERKFSFISGVGIRIRRIPLSAVAPGQVVDGPTIFEADLGNEVDNMEGIDVHQSADGDTILTMVSDDNFSLLQRTLLLQFKLVDP
ncbi:esterase-like activity of phytase family protein [Bradyrhizobium sp. 2TAF24]|uniref:esterase-like activity of phytase family protein n=1 Tax=Bradyrhizobium sp. 2TAF24 TaxID=3233011 RepID=UPI003F8E5A75